VNTSGIMELDMKDTIKMAIGMAKVRKK